MNPFSLQDLAFVAATESCDGRQNAALLRRTIPSMSKLLKSARSLVTRIRNVEAHNKLYLINHRSMRPKYLPKIKCLCKFDIVPFFEKYLKLYIKQNKAYSRKKCLRPLLKYGSVDVFIFYASKGYEHTTYKNSYTDLVINTLTNYCHNIFMYEIIKDRLQFVDNRLIDNTGLLYIVENSILHRMGTYIKTGKVPHVKSHEVPKILSYYKKRYKGTGGYLIFPPFLWNDEIKQAYFENLIS